MKNSHDPRSEAMANLYRSGKTLAEIGEIVGLNRERVRQLIAQDHGLCAMDGGKRKQILLRQQQKQAKRNAACLATYGCSLEQYPLVSGEPAKRFHAQKSLAVRRGIDWNLNLWQWWAIWQESGKWSLRGRGQGYVMCRKGDLGPYAIGNVFIGLATENSSEAQRKNSDIPVGVRKNARYAGYSATRTVNGTVYRLGSFSTAEAAREAYLAVAPVGTGPIKSGKTPKIREPRPKLQMDSVS